MDNTDERGRRYIGLSGGCRPSGPLSPTCLGPFCRHRWCQWQNDYTV